MTREEREYAIDIIQSILDKYEEDECLVAEITIGDEDIEALKLAIKALEQEQEPFINKPCVSSGVCEHDKQKVLEKIRAEIRHFMYDLNPCSSESDYACNYILDIIDKYKAES